MEKFYQKPVYQKNILKQIKLADLPINLFLKGKHLRTNCIKGIHIQTVSIPKLYVLCSLK